MGDLFVECPIHLDAVSIQDVLVFKCGHGFCEPCLEEHFAHHRQSGHPLSCPTCRQPVRRKEAFPVFLTPAQPGSSRSSQPATVEASHTRLVRELREAKAAHANCSGRFVDLQNEIDALRQHGAYHNQTIQHLRDRYDLLEERLAKEAEKSARAKEENNQMQETVAKLQAENQKTSRALEQALQEAQTQFDRAKQFQGYLERYKHERTLQKKKKKAIDNANYRLQPKKEDESLMVVDANAPDTLRQNEPDFRWLDEACEVKGDQITIASDGDMELEEGSEDEAQHSDHDTKGKQREDQVLGPSLKFPSDWNLGLETFIKPSSGTTRKRSRQVGGSKIVKVKMPVGTRAHKPVAGPLVIDRQGRVNGPVALGSRQKLNSKN